MTLAPTWPKPQKTPHNTYQYAQYQPSFSACVGNPSSPAPIQQRAPGQTQRAPTQNLAPTQPRPTSNSIPGISSNPGRNFLVKKLAKFSPIPMSYADLLPSLIANQMAVVTPGNFPVSFPLMVQPQRDLRLSWGCPGALDRTMCGFQT